MKISPNRLILQSIVPLKLRTLYKTNLYELIRDSIAVSHLQRIHTHSEGHFDMETDSGAEDRPHDHWVTTLPAEPRL